MLSIYLVAAAQWGVLAPLNLIKVLLNRVSPWARHWVPEHTEKCQANCEVARMWASLFWSLEILLAIAFIFVHYNRDQVGLVYLGIAAKSVVAFLLVRAYLQGVVFWPIGLAGALDWAVAAMFIADLRKGVKKVRTA